MWTGINDKTTANTFVDVFELNPTFLPWATDEPEAVTADSTNVEQCVAFDKITPLTPFQSVTCDSSHEFICYGHQIDGAQTETLTAGKFIKLRRHKFNLFKFSYLEIKLQTNCSNIRPLTLDLTDKKYSLFITLCSQVNHTKNRTL